MRVSSCECSQLRQAHASRNRALSAATAGTSSFLHCFDLAASHQYDNTAQPAFPLRGHPSCKPGPSISLLEP